MRGKGESVEEGWWISAVWDASCALFHGQASPEQVMQQIFPGGMQPDGRLPAVSVLQVRIPNEDLAEWGGSKIPRRICYAVANLHIWFVKGAGNLQHIGRVAKSQQLES